MAAGALLGWAGRDSSLDKPDLGPLERGRRPARRQRDAVEVRPRLRPPRARTEGGPSLGY